MNKRYVNYYILIILINFISLWTNADELSQSFTYQSKLYDATGLAPLTSGNVSVTFQILSPSGGSQCLLYEEVHTGIDLSTTGGLFTAQVGSTTGATKRTANDPGLTMATVFSNKATQIRAPGANCAVGYTPSPSDERVLKVTWNDGSTTQALGDETISTIPYAMVAEALQGYTPPDFLQVGGNVTQANMVTLTGAGAASALHHHDDRYLAGGGSGNFNMGSGIVYGTGRLSLGNAAPPGTHQFHLESASPTQRMTSTASGGGTAKIEFFSGTTERSSIQASEATNTLSFYTGTTQALSLDASQNASFTANVSTAGVVQPGRYTNAQETTLIGGLAPPHAGSIWMNTDVPGLKFWDGTAAFTLATTSYVAPAAAGWTDAGAVVHTTTSTDNVNIGPVTGGYTNGSGLKIVRPGTATIRMEDTANSTGTEIFTDANGLNFSQMNGGRNFIFAGGNIGIGSTSPEDSLTIKSPVGSEYRGNISLYDTNGIAAGVGGEIVFGGKYTGATTTEWAGIQGAKVNATDGNYAGNLQLRTRSHGGALSTKMIIDDVGNVGIGSIAPSAVVNIKAGTAAAGTAPLKLTAGANLTTPEAGAIEFDGTKLYYTTTTPTRMELATATAVGNYVLKAGDTMTGALAITVAGTGLAVTNDATIGGTLGVTGTITTTNGQVTSGVADGAAAKGFTLNTPAYTTAGANLFSLQNNSVEKFYVDKDGRAGVATPTANDHAATKAYVDTSVGNYVLKAGDTMSGTINLRASTTSAGTAPLKIATGTVMTTPEAGSIEYDGTNLYFTDSGATRRTVATTTQIASSAAGWTDAGAAIYTTTSTDKVGIGTSSPAAALDVVGQTIVRHAGGGSIDLQGTNANAQPYIYMGRGTTNWSLGMSADANATFNISNGYGGGNVMSFLPNGNVGIGTTTPDNNLKISYSASNSTQGLTLENMQTAGHGSAITFHHLGTGDWTSRIQVQNTNSAPVDGIISFIQPTAGTDAQTVMTLKGANVGIGSTAPTAALNIKAGTATLAPLKFTAGTNLTATEPGAVEYDGTNLYYTDGTSVRRTIATTADIAASAGGWTDTGTVVHTTTSTDSVGIGTTSPPTKLTMSGSDAGTTLGTSTAALHIANTNGGANSLAEIQFSKFNDITTSFAAISGVLTSGTANTTGDIAFSTRQATSDGNVTEAMRIKANGSVGIGSTSPTAALNIKAGTATLAPFKLTSGTNLTTPEAGAIEFDGTKLYYTTSAPTRLELATVTGVAGSAGGWTDAGATVHPTTSTDAVGVGTTAASAHLDVRGGDTKSTSNFNTPNSSTTFTTPWPGINITNDNATANNWANIAFSDAINGNPATSINTQFTDRTNDYGDLAFGTRAADGMQRRMTITSTGNVGIGTTAPTTVLGVGPVLHVKGSGGGGVLRLQSSNGSSGGAITVDENEPIRFFTNNAAERMRVAGDGNVGIGTTAPATTLDVNGALSVRGMAAPALSPAGQGRIYFDSTANKFKISENGGAYADIGSGGGGSGGWTDGGTNVYLTTGTDSVGIGTTSPTSALEVLTANGNLGQLRLRTTGDVSSAGTVFMRFNDANGGAGYFGFGGTNNEMNIVNYKAGAITLSTSGTERMRVDSSGNVGIGTTTASNKLVVQSTTADDGIVFQGAAGVDSAKIGRAGGSATGEITLNDASNATKVRIVAGTGSSYFNGGGNVGIGTTTPDQKLHVYQNSDATVISKIELDGATAKTARMLIDVSGSTSSNASLYLMGQGTKTWDIYNWNWSAGELVFASNAGQVVTVTQAGAMSVVGDICTSAGGGKCLSTAGGGSPSGWTDGGTTISTTTSTDDVLIGSLGGTATLNPNSFSSPSLNVRGGSAAQGSSILVGNNQDNNSMILGQWGTSSYVINRGNGPLLFYTNNTEKARIDATGNVGIGTTNPSYSLDISAATAKARVSSSTGTNAAFFEASNTGGWFDIGRERSTGGALLTGDTAYAAVLAAQGTYPMQFGVNDSVVMTLLNGGNVGIGTTVPATVLDINGAMSVRGMAAPTVSPAGQGRIYFDSTANKFKISENGGAYSDIGSGGGSPSNTAYSAHMARVSTTQSIPSGTVTTIDFDTETYDVGGFASTATDRFTIAYAGKYLVQTSWTAYPVASTQCAWLYIHVNGTQRRTIYDCMANNVYGSRQIQSSEIFDLAAGDYIDMRVYQDTGAALNTQTAANGGPQMSVTLMSAGAGDNNNQWTLASGKLYYNGGDVGIGTTAPASALDVAGNMSMRGGVFNSFDPVTPANYLARLTHGGTGNGSFQLYNAGSLNVVLASSGNSYLNGGNVGIGTTAPAQDLHISQAADSVIRLERTSSGSAAEIATAHDSEGFVIRTRTNHGIRFATNTTSGDWTDSTRMFIAAGGNVGVGTTSPNAKMHVNCDTTTVNCLYLNSTGGGGTLALFQTAGVTAGSISIGGGPSIAYNTTSDARLKENIRDSLAGLTDLKRIDVRDYNYIADSSKTSQQGFIAQQLYTIYPEAVTVGGKDPHSQPWSVDYGRLTPLIVKSVQELNNKCEMSQEQLASIQHIVARHERDIASVKTENEKLKRENVAQAKELEAIKARLEKIEKALNSK